MAYEISWKMNSFHNHRDGIFNILLPRIVKFQTINGRVAIRYDGKKYSEQIILIGIGLLGLVILDYAMNILINLV